MTDVQDASTTTHPPTDVPPRDGLATLWWRAAVATLVIYAVTLLLVVVATAVVPVGEPASIAPAAGFGGWDAPPSDVAGVELLRTGLVRQDALWYLAIAADGYPTTAEVPPAVAFFPGFPAVVAGVGALLGGNLVAAAQLVALLACIAALAGLQRLAQLVGGDRLAARTLLAVAVFPTSFFLVAPFTEGMFVAAATWSLVAAAEDRPGRAAVLAAVATSVRSVGILLAVPIVLGVLHRDRRSLGRRAVPLLGIAATGTALLVHGWLRYGDPLAILTAQQVWERTIRLFPMTIFHGVRFGLQALVDGSTPYHLLDVLVLAMTITGIVGLARRREWPLVLHGAVSVLLWTTSVFDGRPFMSTPRFALAVPAVFLGIAVLLEGERFERAWLPLSGALFAVHAVLFTRWLYVF